MEQLTSEILQSRLDFYLSSNNTVDEVKVDVSVLVELIQLALVGIVSRELAQQTL